MPFTPFASSIAHRRCFAEADRTGAGLMACGPVFVAGPHAPAMLGSPHVNGIRPRGQLILDGFDRPRGRS